MAWPIKTSQKTGAFSDEDVCVISKDNTSIIWAGTKAMYSGNFSGTPLAASGYNFLSGETDVEPIGASGWARIRIPEVNQLHHVYVFPHDPKIIGRVAYTSLNLAAGSGLPDGHGGCSGKMALVNYNYYCSGCGSGWWIGAATSQFNSGLIDVIAFGSQF